MSDVTELIAAGTALIGGLAGALIGASNANKRLTRELDSGSWAKKEDLNQAREQLEQKLEQERRLAFLPDLRDLLDEGTRLVERAVEAVKTARDDTPFYANAPHRIETARASIATLDELTGELTLNSRLLTTRRPSDNPAAGSIVDIIAVLGIAKLALVGVERTTETTILKNARDHLTSLVEQASTLAKRYNDAAGLLIERNSSAGKTSAGATGAA